MSKIPTNSVCEAHVSNDDELKKESINKDVKNDEVNKKRKYKEVAPYGNYRNYYGYRVGNDMENDPRFKLMKKDWFEGRDCLDIGCNSGLITLNIAKKFKCRSILGIDIDNARVNDAWSNLKKFGRSKKSEDDRNIAPKPKLETNVNGLESAETCSTSGKEVKNGCFSVEPCLSDIVSFQCQNFVLKPLPLKQYDTVICLSMTKWVHLNWGDEGLMSLFSKIWRLLRSGGILVLEPQPWVSYYKNRLTTETTQTNYHKICFKPKDFQEILLDKIGFQTVEQATSSVPGATAGFDRPVLVFRK